MCVLYNVSIEFLCSLKTFNFFKKKSTNKDENQRKFKTKKNFQVPMQFFIIYFVLLNSVNDLQ